MSDLQPPGRSTPLDEVIRTLSLRRRPRGRSALGAAVTALPSAPLGGPAPARTAAADLRGPLAQRVAPAVATAPGPTAAPDRSLPTAPRATLTSPDGMPLELDPTSEDVRAVEALWVTRWDAD